MLRGLLVALAVLTSLGCAQPPEPGGVPDQTSLHGLVEAALVFEGGLRRGDNTLRAELTPLQGSGVPLLVSAEALMAGHGHHAQAEHIQAEADGFRATGLNLFMTGRWQVELAVELNDAVDSISFPVDVP